MSQAHAYPEAVDRLIAEFSRLPGVGRRTAERLTFHLLKSPKQEALRFAEAIQAVKARVHHCSICFNLTEVDPCPICRDARRDPSVVLVVEQPKDLISLEQTGMYEGVYHVLMGRLDPLNGIGPEDLTVPRLLERVADPSKNSQGARVQEAILGLNPDLEGDGTALYLGDQLQNAGVRVTRLARGLPTGSQLEFASKAVLSDAIQGRQPVT